MGVLGSLPQLAKPSFRLPRSHGGAWFKESLLSAGALFQLLSSRFLAASVALDFVTTHLWRGVAFYGRRPKSPYISFHTLQSSRF